MKNILYILFFVSIMSAVSACEPFGIHNDAAPPELTLLPGECLNSNRLSCYQSSNNKGDLDFSLYLDWDYDERYIDMWMQGYIAWFPSEAVFDSFGEDKDIVKNCYYSVYSRLSAQMDRTTTVFYKEGVSITANKEFCGVPVGENLFPTVAQMRFNSENYKLSEECIPDGYKTFCSWSFDITIPKNNYKVLSESVRFHVEIPVKVGMYLHYLLDKEKKPEAQMQFREEVLIGNFVSDCRFD